MLRDKWQQAKEVISLKWQPAKKVIGPKWRQAKKVIGSKWQSAKEVISSKWQKAKEAISALFKSAGWYWFTQGGWVRMPLLFLSLAAVYLIVPVQLLPDVLNSTKHDQYAHVLLLSSLVAIAAASWWHKEINHMTKQRKLRPACWRRAVFLLFLVAGTYGISVVLYGKLVQHRYFIPKTTIGNVVTSGSGVPCIQNVSDVAIAKSSVEEVKPPIEFLSLFGFIMAVVTAYYLVVLQETTKRSQALLEKLDQSKAEIEDLKKETKSLDNATMGVFTSIGKFVYDFALVMREQAPAHAQEKLKINTDVLLQLLELHQQLQTWRNPPFLRPPKLCSTIKQLHIQLKKSDFQAGNYVPLNLLKEIKEQLEGEMQNSPLDAASRTEISDTLRTIKKLEQDLDCFN